MNSKNAASRKQVLMIAGGFFLLVATFVEPGLLSHLSCQSGTITMGFIALCGFLAAKVMRRLAGVFLRDEVAPWYAGRGVAIFLCVAVPCINPLYTRVDDFFVSAGMMEQVTSQQARMFIFMALELLWMALLD